MIKATTNGDQTQVQVKGKTMDIAVELMDILKSVSISLADGLNLEELSNDKAAQVESVIYSITMATCEKLNRDGIEVDPRKIAISMLAAKADIDESGPTGSGNSHGDQ